MKMLILYIENMCKNAADQIDIAVENKILKSKKDGEINITIDKLARKIVVADNATGIKSENALKFLADIANSQKNPDQRKGFRGIGRLGGLGYCDKLIFETSYKGENQRSEITLNASDLRSILADDSDTKDAASVYQFYKQPSKSLCVRKKNIISKLTIGKCYK